MGRVRKPERGRAAVRLRRNLAVHQAVDEDRAIALLRTPIIAACKATLWEAA
jgi:hypothetical protein